MFWSEERLDSTSPLPPEEFIGDVEVDIRTLDDAVKLCEELGGSFEKHENSVLCKFEQPKHLRKIVVDYAPKYTNVNLTEKHRITSNILITLPPRSTIEYSGESTNVSEIKTIQDEVTTYYFETDKEERSIDTLLFVEGDLRIKGFKAVIRSERVWFELF